MSRWNDVSLAGDPRLLARPTWVTALVSLGGTLFVALLVAPWLADALASLSDLEAFGASVLFGSSVRLLAGVYGARAYRRREGTQWRHEPLLCVVTGVTAAWLAYAAIVLLAGLLAGDGGASWRLLLELPRWVVEAVLGTYLVAPDGPEDDTVVARLARRGTAS
jgi:hypothetical protein